MAEPEFLARARRHGAAIALRSPEGAMSYGALIEGSGAGAAALLAGRADLDGARVALLLPPTAAFVVAQWSVWRAGGVCVPLSLHATPAEWEHVLADSRADLVLTTTELAPRGTSLAARLGIPVRLVGADGRAAAAAGLADTATAVAASLPDVDAQRAATILYTSGTTSRPKGVVITHANLAAQVTSLVAAWAWSEADRIPLFLPLHHVHGLANVLACALWAGATVEMLGEFDADRVLERVAAGAYTLFMAVPTIYVKLVARFDTASGDDRARWAAGFAGLRLMVSGSAALPASLHARWTELTGQALLERYGMTEIGMALSNPLVGERRPGAVGVPLPGVSVRLVGDDGGVITGEDEPGEIQVRGAGVFAQYWDRPDATRESFDGDWFRTGDIAVVERGYYRIMGRRSIDIIKSGGYKLSALEIEAALLEHPAIAECAVIGVPDATWGELVVAVVVARAGQRVPDLDELRAWCRDRLSPYKLPRRVVARDALPRNAMGKVTKPVLAKQLAAQ
jgi:malonyl-CoA/methylmalonyl-CoA synthetase